MTAVSKFSENLFSTPISARAHSGPSGGGSRRAPLSAKRRGAQVAAQTALAAHQRLQPRPLGRVAAHHVGVDAQGELGVGVAGLGHHRGGVFPAGDQRQGERNAAACEGSRPLATAPRRVLRVADRRARSQRQGHGYAGCPYPGAPRSWSGIRGRQGRCGRRVLCALPGRRAGSAAC